jgi:hypothetical protein
MKFIAFGEAVCKVKDNKEFGKEAIKGWENLSKDFAKLLSCAHADEAQYGLFCLGYSPGTPHTLHYIIQKVQIIR